MTFVGQTMTDIEDLAFRPASNVVTDDDGPLRGDTVFGDVPYICAAHFCNPWFS